MILSFWSTLLFTSGIQCILLIFFLGFKSADNHRAKKLLIALLSLVLLVNLSSLISANYWYREIPHVAGFARGMVLLFGPLIYLYSLSITDSNFRFRWKQLVHFIPYFVSVIFVRIQMYGVDPDLYIEAVDALMAGTMPMNGVVSLWFVSYFVQLFVYVLLIRRQLNKRADHSTNRFQVEFVHRKKWINRLSLMLSLLGILFLALSVYCLVTSTNSAKGNFLYTLILAVGTHIIAYQTILEKEILFPEFKKKYASNALNDEVRMRLIEQFRALLEEEKVFTDPDIKLGVIASRVGVHPTLVSRFINSEYNQSFNDLIHVHRIEEFKRRLKDPNYLGYSIFGIAQDVGYNSKSTFNTAFKRLNGQTPSTYLKEIREE